MELYSRNVVLFFIVYCLKTLACPPRCDCTLTPGRVICSPRLSSFPRCIAVNTKAIILAATQNSKNTISHIEQMDLLKLPDLEEIYISFSGLTGVEDNTFDHTGKLRRLTLKYNTISKITNFTFHGLAHLEQLDLSGNKGCIIETGSLSSLLTLMYLFLADMKLSKLENGIFSGLSSLRSLDLHGNDFFEINSDVFISLINLTSLDMSSNHLVTLSESLAPFLNKLHVNLEDNPWHCNCQIQWLKTSLLQSLNHYPHSTAYNVICYTPASLKYKTMIQVLDDKMKCHPPKVSQCDGPYDVVLKRPISISCLIKGDPLPHFIWIKPDKSHAEENRFNISSVDYVTSSFARLHIKHANIEDDGKWSISIKSKYGQQIKSFIVHVVVPTTTPTPTTTSEQTTTAASRVYEKMNPGFVAAAAGFAFTTLVTCCTCICTAKYVRKRRVKGPKDNVWHKGDHVDDVTVVVGQPSK